MNPHCTANVILHPTGNQPQCSNSLLSGNFAQGKSFNESDVEDEKDLGPYEPELSEKENPHYYAANEILYNAHAQRNQRHPHKDNQLQYLVM